MDITVLNPVDIVSVLLLVILLKDVVPMDVTLDGSHHRNVINVRSILSLYYNHQALSKCFVM